MPSICFIDILISPSTPRVQRQQKTNFQNNEYASSWYILHIIHGRCSHIVVRKFSFSSPRFTFFIVVILPSDVLQLCLHPAAHLHPPPPAFPFFLAIKGSFFFLSTTSLYPASRYFERAFTPHPPPP